MSKEIQAFNATTQAMETAVVSVANNNEFLVTFENGAFIKFPAGMTAKELKAALVKEEEVNKGVVFAEAEEAQKAENEAVLEDL